MDQYKGRVIAKYKLLKDLPCLKSGVIFEHRSYDVNHPDRGNIGAGCMILAWDKNGNCQKENNNWGWCGETYIFPGQLAENKEWFSKIEDYSDWKEEARKNDISILEKKVDEIVNYLKVIKNKYA